MTAHTLTLPDTRTLAKAWFDANVPAGSKVLIEGGKIEPARETVPLAGHAGGDHATNRLLEGCRAETGAISAIEALGLPGYGLRPDFCPAQFD